MKKIILTLFCIFISLIGFSQTCEQIIKSAKKIAFQDKNYELAIKKLGAIFISKDCDSSKISKANNLINQIYKEVNNQRVLAEIKTKEAVKEANHAKALYWASESEKLPPYDAINLLDLAFKKDSSVQLINEKLKKIFNSFSKSKFREVVSFTAILFQYPNSNKFIVSNRSRFGGSNYYELTVGDSLTVVKKYPFLIEKYLGTIIPSKDLKYIYIKDVLGSYSKIYDVNRQLEINKFTVISQNEIQIETKKIEFFENFEYYPNQKNKVIEKIEKVIISEHLKNKLNILGFDSTLINDESKSKSISSYITLERRINNNQEFLLIRKSWWELSKRTATSYIFDYQSQDFPDFLTELSINKNDIYDMRFSEDENFIIIELKNNKKIIWDNIRKERINYINTNDLSDIFLKENKWLIVVYRNYEKSFGENVYNFWDYKNKNEVELSNDEIRGVSLSFLYNGNYVLVERTGINVIYKLPKSETKYIYYSSSEMGSFFLDKSEKYITLKGKEPKNDTIINIINTETWEYLIDQSKKDFKGLRSFDFSSNNCYAISESRHSKNIWGISSSDKLPQLDTSKRVKDYIFSDNKEWLITLYADSSTNIFNCEKKRNLNILKNVKVLDISISDDSKFLIYKYAPSYYKLIDLNTEEIPSFIKKESFFKQISFSHDLKFLITVEKDSVSIYEISSRKLIFQKEANKNCIYRTNGRLLLNINSNNGIKDVTALNSESVDTIFVQSKYKNIFIGKNVVTVDTFGIVTFHITNNKILSHIQSKFRSSDEEEKNFLLGNNRFIKLYDLQDGTINSIVDVNKKTEFKFSSTLQKYRTLKAIFSNNEGWILCVVAPSLSRNSVEYKYKLYKPELYEYELYKVEEQNLKRMGNLSKIIKSFTSIQQIRFINELPYIYLISGPELIIIDILQKKEVASYWLNKDISQVYFSKSNEYLYISSGNALVRFPLKFQGNYFSFGDSEGTNYDISRIKSWRKQFGDIFISRLNFLLKDIYEIK